MPYPQHGLRAGERGTVIVGVLFFLLVISILLMGMGAFSVSHETRAKVDADYASAMDVAEAGINYELSKITADVHNADAKPGTTMAFGPGSYRAYCAGDINGTTAWPPATGNPPNTLYVFATGTVNGVSRTLRVSIKGYNTQGDFAVYGINGVSLQGTVDIYGDIGSNGPIHNQGSCTIEGTVYCNGPGSSYDGTGNTIINNPDPLIWPTVHDLANEMFPQGGLTYIATHNDNGMVSSSSFQNNTITGSVTLVGKPGGANYYVTSVSLTGNSQVSFDNLNGPINIWVGPETGTGTVDFRGTTDGTTDVTQGGNQVNIYIATQGAVSLTMKGNSTLRANVYDYNITNEDDPQATHTPYGSVSYQGTPDLYGTILAYNVSLGGTPGIYYVIGSDQPDSDGFYGYNDSWVEIGGRTY